VPFDGVTLSHDASLAAVKLNVPVPVLLMLSDEGAGLDPPTTALKVKAVGETDRMGTGCGLTVRVTVTTLGEPCAAVAVIVTCPV
jgi:hypothetical protein